MKANHRLTTAGALLIGSFTVLAGCDSPLPKAEEKHAAKTVQAATDLVKTKEKALTYSVSGTVKPVLNSTVASKVLGRVVSVAVKEGDTVRKGQLLLTIDARELEAGARIAGANYQAAVAGASSAETAVQLEIRTSKARINQAESQVQQAQAAIAAAQAKYELALAGPRTQEVSQSHIAVMQAESNLKLAQIELDRAKRLVESGAIAKRELDLAQNRFELAQGQYNSAVESEKIAKEGTRSQDIRAALEGVTQAKAALKQAQSGLAQAKAAAMQIDLRRKDVEVARAQVNQASAAVNSAGVSLSYTKVFAPFDGRVSQRMVDPGAMAAPGSPLIVIQGAEFRFESAIPERYLRAVEKGTKVPIKIDALTGQNLMGQAAEIVPQGNGSAHTFTVKFRLSSTTGLKSGLYGKAEIPTGKKSTIEIPAAAIIEREGLRYVYLVGLDGTARLRLVTGGQPENGKVEIYSGLNEGERIVISSESAVSDGDKIEGAGK